MSRRERETEKKLRKQRDEARAELGKLNASELVGAMAKGEKNAKAMYQSINDGLRGLVTDLEDEVRRLRAWGSTLIGDVGPDLDTYLDGHAVLPDPKEAGVLRKRLMKKAEEARQLEDAIRQVQAEAAQLRTAVHKSQHPAVQAMFDAMLATDQPMLWVRAPVKVKPGTKCSFKDCTRDGEFVLGTKMPGRVKPGYIVTCKECLSRPTLATETWGYAPPATEAPALEPVTPS